MARQRTDGFGGATGADQRARIQRVDLAVRTIEVVGQELDLAFAAQAQVGIRPARQAHMDVVLGFSVPHQQQRGGRRARARSTTRDQLVARPAYAVSAAPSSPASLPSLDGTMSTSRAADARIWRRAISAAHSTYRSPRASAIPPPITTTAGSTRLTTPPIARPDVARAATGRANGHRVGLRDRLRQVATGQRQQVAAENLGEHGAVAARDLVDHVTTNRVARGHRFEAAGAAASAARPAGAHHHVADLAGPAVRAVVQAAVDHDPATDAGADEDRQHRVVAPAGAQRVLAQGRGAHVVFDEHALCWAGAVRALRERGSRPSPGWAPWPPPTCELSSGPGRTRLRRRPPRTAGQRRRPPRRRLRPGDRAVRPGDRSGRGWAAIRASARFRRPRRRRPAPWCRPDRSPPRARGQPVRTVIDGSAMPDASRDAAGESRTGRELEVDQVRVEAEAVDRELAQAAGSTWPSRSATNVRCCWLPSRTKVRGPLSASAWA